MKDKIIKIIKRIALWSAVSMASLIVLIFLLIQIPLVQTFIAQKTAAHFSKEWGAKVSIGRLSISPFLNISVSEVEIEDQNHSRLLFIDNAYAFFNDISFRNRSLDFSKITILSPDVNLKKYQGDSVLNFQFLIDYFESPKEEDTKAWSFNFDKISLLGAKLSYVDENLPKNDGKSVDFGNLNFKNLNLEVSDLKIHEDSIGLQLTRFSVYDSSGFYIKELTAKVMYSNEALKLEDVKVQTFLSDIRFNLLLKYDSPDDFADFFNKVNLNLEVLPSKFNTQDVAFFMPDVHFFNNDIAFAGFIRGKLNRLMIRNIYLKYGTNTELQAKAAIDGLPNIEESFVDFNIENFTTSITDVQNFNLPNRQKINIPSNLFSAKNIKLKGIFTGFINDFVVNANLQTAAGTIVSDVNLKTKNNQFAYKGKVATENFNPGLFIKDLNQIADLSMSAEVNGKGKTLKTLSLEFQADITNVLIESKTSLSNLKMVGSINEQIVQADISIDDPNIRMISDIQLGIKKNEEFIKLKSQIYSAKFTQLKLINRAPYADLKSRIEIDLKGNSIDNFIGSVRVFDFKYLENQKLYVMDRMVVTSSIDMLGMKNINLSSDWLDADIVGKFLVSDIGAIAQNIMDTYFPRLKEEEGEVHSAKKDQTEKNDKVLPTENRYFSFDFLLKNAGSLTQLFMPDLKISDQTFVSGFVNAKNNTINMNLHTDFIGISTLELENIDFSTKTFNDKLNFELKSDVLHLSKKEQVFLKNLSFNGDIIQNNILYQLKWNGSNNTLQNYSDISGELRMYKDHVEADIYESNMVINDSTWVIEKGNSIVISKDSYQINKLLINSRNKYVFINGTVSKDPEKTLNIELKNIDLSEADPLTALRQFDLDGVMTGNIEIVDALDKISFITSLKIKNLGLNNQRLGDADLVSVWDHRKKGLFINGEVIHRGNVGENRPVNIQGYYYPALDSLDITADLLNFRLKTIEKYLSVILYKLEGFASGKLHVVGTLKKPELVGNLKLMRTSVGLKELNTEYTINHHLIIERNGFKFNNVEIYDTETNVGVLNGFVSHKNFKDFYVDISIRANSLMALNTNQSQSDLFYGKVFGTGLVTIKGPAEKIVINAQISSDRNTEMFIPISYATSVSENSFIRFVTPEDKAIKKDINVATADGSSVQMNFLINVSPNARFTIFLDPSTGGTIRGAGNGALRMEANTNGEFNMYGVYTVTEGEYMMTLKDVINKKFNIEDGGTIRWNGDPTDADINLKAIYRTRASLTSLMGADSTNTNTQVSGRRIPVNSELYLTGKLMNPTVSFGISLPTADNYTKSMFYNLLDTTNDQSMIRQTFSLLIFGRFENENTQYGNMVGEGLGSSSLDMVASQLSNLISQYSRGLDVGLNYRQGDDVHSEEIQVNLSTELFNERLIIDGNLGLGGQNVYQQNANQIVGDVKIEYKVTKDGRVRIKGFNQQNNNEFTNVNAPYTQGVALVYRKDFNRFKEIFIRSKKKKKNAKDSTTTTK